MYSRIHRSAPEFNDQSTETEILVTGIKVIDLLAPYAKGVKIHSTKFSASMENGQGHLNQRAKISFLKFLR